MDNNFRIETNCVQGAYQPKNGESRVMPIVQSTTWKYSITRYRYWADWRCSCTA